MGTWGPGLYASDLASDLKTLIATAVKLPVDTPELVELIVARNRDVADDPADDDHATFWLVLADGLHRAGIAAPDVFARANAIVDDGVDAAAMRRLGMGDADRARRAGHLAELRARLAGPLPVKKRRTLRGPEPLLFAVGDLIVYPVDGRGHTLNPYFPASNDVSFTPVGFGAACVVDATLAFGFLAVYSVVTARSPAPLPRFEPAAFWVHEGWGLELPATCPKAHHRRMGVERVGTVDLLASSDAVLGRHRSMRESCAISDIGITNRLAVHARGTPVVARLSDIAAAR